MTACFALAAAWPLDPSRPKRRGRDLGDGEGGIAGEISLGICSLSAPGIIIYFFIFSFS